MVCQGAEAPLNPLCSSAQGTITTRSFNITNGSGFGFIHYGEQWFVSWQYQNAGRIDVMSSSTLGFTPRIVFTQEVPNTGNDKLTLPSPISAPWGTLTPCQSDTHTSSLAAVPAPPAGKTIRGVVVSLEGVPASAHASSRVVFQN
jgi:hypothetical protein